MEDKWRELERLAASWQKVQLPLRHEEMDRAALEISDQQDAIVAARKALQERTKAFQRLTADTDKLTEMGPLIKAYQREIDALTKRAKFAEAVFLDVYQWLHEAPDPVPAITQILSSKPEVPGGGGASSEEVQGLRRRLAEYEHEFRDLKNQEVTIESLRLTVQQYQEQLQEAIRKGVEAHLQEEGARQAALLASLQEGEEALQRRLRWREDENRRLAAEHAGCQQQILRLSSALEEARAQREGTDSTLQEEVEALASKVTLLELENTQLRSTRSPTPAAPSHYEMVDALQDEIQRKDDRLAQTLEQHAEAERRLQAEQQALRDCREQLTAARAAIERLQNQLQALPTPADLDRLRTRLKALEDIDGDLGDSGAGDEDVPRLRRDLARARGHLAEATAQLDIVTLQCEDLRKQVLGQADVLRRLDGSVARQYGVGLDLESSGIDLAAYGLDPSSSQDAGRKVPNSGAPAPDGADDASPTGLIHVLVGQRDRLKSRVRELEGEKQHLERMLKAARAEVQELKTDNVALYHKARTLSAPGGDRGSGRRRGVLDDEELEGRYHRQYDEAVPDPTSPRQKDIPGPRLSAPERITLTAARALLSTSPGRYLVLVYLSLLHGLVVATLYWHSHGAHMPKP